MTDRNTRDDRPEAGPERVAVYDRPGPSAEPISTTGTTGTSRPVNRGATPVGWLIPAAVLLLLIVVLLWWL